MWYVLYAICFVIGIIMVYLPFSGEHCDIDINECQLLIPCHNNATCVDSINSYSCQCLSGYSGLTCQHVINPCLEGAGLEQDEEGAGLQQQEGAELCRNGGRCELAAPGEYQCVCADGWSGELCTVNAGNTAGCK